VFSHPNRYAHHIRRKPNKYTKQDERNARGKRASTREGTPPGLGQSVSQQSVATFAEKEKKKMTHSKQTTYNPLHTEQQPNFYQPIELVIEPRAIAR
jgi:hypothetical protein